MRYQEILESTNENLIDSIKRECSDILSIYRHTFNTNSKIHALWRGIGSNRGEILKSQIRGAEHTDGDIAVELRHMIDDSLKASGCTAVRSNSIMTSGYNVASNYGDPYVVFPVNGCSYTWYANQQAGYTLFDYISVFEECIPDLDDQDIYKSSIKQYIDKMTPEQINILKNAVMEKTKEMEPETSNIEKGIMLTNEFLISGSSYYIIRGDVVKNYIPSLFGD